MKHKKRLSFSIKFTVVICSLLLVINAVLGVVLLSQSGNSMETLIRNHMTAVSSTAASLIDGDVLASFTEEDVGTEAYQKISDLLITVKNVQKDADIKYIYIIKKVDEGFVFIVDPDPENPADFGEEIVYTPEQEKAWEGTPQVDAEATEDEWGCYYSAWSPITDSSGKVVALVGIDFAADWYRSQEAAHSRSVVIVSVLSIIVGAAVALILTARLRRRFRALNGELSVLSEDLDELSAEIDDSHGEQAPVESGDKNDDGNDMIVSLSIRIRSMQVKLKNYLRYIHEKAYTDSMTSVGNKTAYLDRVKEINHEIESGGADFALAIFDINGLKSINDKYGHEVGDMVITDAAEMISHAFPDDHIFRVGGDEFVAVVYSSTEEKLMARFDEIDEEIAAFNAGTKDYEAELSISHGGTEFHKDADREYNDVFRRADQYMYNCKAAYYRRNGGSAHSSEADDEIAE